MSEVSRKNFANYTKELAHYSENDSLVKGECGPVYPLPAGRVVGDVNLFGYHIKEGPGTADEVEYFFKGNREVAASTVVLLPLGITAPAAKQMGFVRCHAERADLPGGFTDKEGNAVPIVATGRPCFNYVSGDTAAKSAGLCARCWWRSIEQHVLEMKRESEAKDVKDA